MAEAAVVAGMGMISAVGVSAPEVAASVRAGTMRLAESSIMDKRFEPFTLAEVPEDMLPPLNPHLEQRGLTSRETRMLRLADVALRECLQALPPGAAAPPVIMALPEIETTRPLDPNKLLDGLFVQVGGFARNYSEANYRGRAGGLAAISRAVDWLNAGAPYVIAGGVDTYRDLYVLGTLDMEQRVKSSSNLDGFVPGEGAAFILLARRQTAVAARVRPIAAISGFTAGVEPGHMYSEQPYRGDGLAAVFATSLSNGAGAIADVYSSMNGENHWAKEWGVAFMRSRGKFEETHGMHHPADCHGDTGAAAGPIMVGLAALGMSGGYRRSPCLVYGSSDRGERAALIVSAG
jgi:3-oxoacyl-[acyl-carrier-protein] synthase-1